MKSNFITDFIDEDIKTNRFNRKIQTRFPPEPNGFLHIGHAKAIFISFEIAKKYNGKCNLRYDDTNPSKEDDVFVKSIKKDIEWLGFKPFDIFFASDYFDRFYDYALILIEKNLAFVDDSSAEEIKKMRGTLREPGLNSPYRERSISENKKLFKEMKEGLYNDGEKVLRAKIDMSSSNLNMRDPVLYRISKTPHHRTKDEWSIYPMYDFAHPLEDAIENITHSLCTLEFEAHRPLYDWVLENVDIKYPPRQIEFSRLNITNTVLSKRHLMNLVIENKVDSWEDPRMPTLSGLRRRGYTPEAIKTFVEEAGISKSNSEAEISMLEHFVREDLKENVENRNVVFNPIKVIIENYPDDKSEELEIENSKLNPELGKRKITFSKELYIDGNDFMIEPIKKYFRLFPGNEVRLSGAYFIKCKDVIKNSDETIKELICTYDPNTKSGLNFTERKVKGTIHFVDAKNYEKITVNELDYLFVENDKKEFIYNTDSKKEVTAFAEKSIKNAKYKERFQFFRKGFYILDEFSSSENEKVFNSIVSLKSGFKL